MGQCGENWPTPKGRKNRKEGAEPEIPRLSPSPARATSPALSPPSEGGVYELWDNQGSRLWASWGCC